MVAILTVYIVTHTSYDFDPMGVSAAPVLTAAGRPALFVVVAPPRMSAGPPAAAPLMSALEDAAPRQIVDAVHAAAHPRGEGRGLFLALVPLPLVSPFPLSTSPVPPVSSFSRLSSPWPRAIG